jgi:hypothetical protein
MKLWILTLFLLAATSAFTAVPRGRNSNPVPRVGGSPCAIRLTWVDKTKIAFETSFTYLSAQSFVGFFLSQLEGSKTIWCNHETKKAEPAVGGGTMTLPRDDDEHERMTQVISEVEEATVTRWKGEAERRLRRWYAMILKHGTLADLPRLITLRDLPMVHRKPGRSTEEDLYESGGHYEGYPIAYELEEPDCWKAPLEEVSLLHEKYVDLAFATILHRTKRNDHFFDFLLKHDEIREFLRREGRLRPLADVILKQSGAYWQELFDAGW